MLKEQKYYIIKYREDLENNDFDKFFNRGPIPQGMCDVIYKAIPNCLKQMSYIPALGFANTNIELIDIPNSITIIKSCAFWLCTSLASIDIPDSITKIGDYAFSGCTSLRSVNIPDSVVEINGSAFENCDSLSEVIYKGKKYNSLTTLTHDLKRRARNPIPFRGWNESRIYK